MRRCLFCKGWLFSFSQSMHTRCAEAVHRMWDQDQRLFADSPVTVTTDELTQAKRRWQQEDEL